MKLAVDNNFDSTPSDCSLVCPFLHIIYVKLETAIYQNKIQYFVIIKHKEQPDFKLIQSVKQKKV